MNTSAAKLLKQLRKRFPDADLAIVRRAYRRAVLAHQGQRRHSGEPYVNHVVEVAQILAKLGLDPVTVAAALLHDVIEDTETGHEELAQEFGEAVANLVDGVTKISHLHLPKAEITREMKQAQNLRKMLVATAQDVRVILIKLADRLHNMRTIEYLPVHKRRRIARETLDIYCPLAHRLGISAWKWELEDHAFHILMPEEYKEIARRVATKRQEREKSLQETIDYIAAGLEESEVAARVIGRPKHLFSIYQKMVRQGKSFEEVLDIEAVRIITQTVSGCYNALGLVHNLWMPVPGRFKDYIAMPKLNMYQGIHTTVMRPGGRPLEIQIRTEDMDRTSREGIAAHWVYKEGVAAADDHIDEQLSWLRQMYEWLKDAHAPDDLLDSMRRDFNPSYIYVFTPKGEVFELPRGATALDFAYHVHSEIGNECIGVRVNGQPVPLRYHVQTGDQIEVLRSKSQVPQMEWLDIVATGRARTKIRARLREIGELDPLDERRGTHDELQPPAPTVPLRKVRQVDDATRRKLIRVETERELPIMFARCCEPMPGHAVLGYVTKAQNITIHRADCKHFVKSERDPLRTLVAMWEGEARYRFGCEADVRSRPNLLADLTNALRPMNIEMVVADYRQREAGHSVFTFAFETDEAALIERVARTLRTVDGVRAVRTSKLSDTETVLEATA